MYPQRIVCLTEEPTEVLSAIGEVARIVGISGFTVRPISSSDRSPSALGEGRGEGKRAA